MADFVISVSYGNYLIQSGGTDKVIREHQKIFSERDVDYLFIFPVVRTIKVAGLVKTVRYWGLDLNKKFCGLFQINDIVDLVKSFIDNGNLCHGVFIHHLWRSKVDELNKVLCFVNAPVFFILHDYYSVCSGKNLISPSGIYCGYGHDIHECKETCAYYAESIVNRKNLTCLVHYYHPRIRFIAPSDFTRNVFRSTFPEFKDLFITIPHQKLSGKYIKAWQKDAPIKIAFIGKQDDIKGWNDFKTLVRALPCSQDYVFYYLGTGEEHLVNVKVMPVSVRDQGSDAMLNALRQNKIDVVMLLSHCPETYSYTYFESYAAGCYIIGYKNSGNIADMITRVGNGIVVDRFEQLFTLLSDSDKLKNSLQHMHESGIRFPDKLIPNHEILALMGLNMDEASTTRIDNVITGKKCKIATMIYRFQNRSKLNEANQYS